MACYTKAHGEGKSERYLASGEKLANTRRMYDDLDSHPVITARFGPGRPAHPAYVRWRGCHVAMLDCAEAVRAGNFPLAAERLAMIQAAAVAREEVIALVRRLIYFLYYPSNDAVAARRQCGAWLRQLAAELERIGPATLHAFVLALARQNEVPSESAMVERWAQ